MQRTKNPKTFQNAKKIFETAKPKKKHIEVLQYKRYALLPGVSSPPGNRVSAIAQTDRPTTHGYCDLETESDQWADAVKLYTLGDIHTCIHTHTQKRLEEILLRTHQIFL